MPAGFWKLADYVVLDSSDPEYMLSSIDKVVADDCKFYILDWSKRRLLVFDEYGLPVMRVPNVEEALESFCRLRTSMLTRTALSGYGMAKRTGCFIMQQTVHFPVT
ncbi:MAG: 6-bladed beta-propeller [Bacteroidales bacterium]|nr:6-bladed beta-propeller [Bacteroidales bacterium]